MILIDSESEGFAKTYGDDDDDDGDDGSSDPDFTTNCYCHLPFLFFAKSSDDWVHG